MMPTTMQTAHKRSGFSLIEVVVAMMLLTVVMGALSVLAAKTSARARRADILAKRNFVLVQQINRYSGVPFDTLRFRLNNALLTSKDTIWGDTLGGAVKYFVRRDTVYYYGNPMPASPADTFVVEAKIVIVPRTPFLSDTQYKDSVVIHRRNPHMISRLNY
jgi:prepilin-type N-terminal cleavage/methylation domain-containing protein